MQGFHALLHPPLLPWPLSGQNICTTIARRRSESAPQAYLVHFIPGVQQEGGEIIRWASPLDPTTVT